MRTTLALLLFVCSFSASAETPYLVKDINTTNSHQIKSSVPSEFAKVGNTIYFAANTDPYGPELWTTDGTSGGTKLVADIVPGTSGSGPSGFSSVNGVFLFNARDVNHGIELWTSDGTAAGTHLLLDVNPGPSSGQPTGKFLYKTRLLFSADDGVNGRELWVTDGTAGGTRMLKDLNPGSVGSFPFNFTQLGGSVYFFAAGALWKTDATEAGTVPVAGVSGRSMVAAGSRLFFEGFSPESGREPWVSDGTAAGTHRILDVLPGTSGSTETSYVTPFVALDQRALFLANDGVHGRELWVTDGTAAGTHMVRDLLPGPKGPWDFSYPGLTAFNGRAYFSMSDADHGLEVWVTDGTEEGTQLFLDSAPGKTPGFPFYFTVSGGKLYFAAGSDYLSGSPLWVSDGTAAGTHRLRAPDELGLGFNDLVAPLWPVDGKIYFSGFTPLTGGEPWVTDGTDAGTHMIANIVADGAPSSNPYMFTPLGNLLFFHATEGTLAPSNVAEASLWRTDGTAAGTFKLREAGQHPPALLPAGNVLFFSQSFDPLTMTDGTLAGTGPADAYLQGKFGSNRLTSTFVFGDTVFALVNGVLWKTAAAPNAPAVNLGARNANGLIEAGGHWMFWAENGTFKMGLWTTDGTAAGTYAVFPDFGADDLLSPSNLVNAAGTIFFAKTLRDSNTTKLWRSDGTADGTVVVKEIGANVESIAAAGRRAFFVAGGSLWTSDGTAAGTVALTAVKSSPGSPTKLVPAGNRIVYVQYLPYPLSGTELWASDGTAAGTKLLMTFNAYLQPPAAVDGIVYLQGYDDAHGAELWTTDGTAEGTKLFVDVDPGPSGSFPDEFVKIGNTLYFRASTDTTGTELWALPLTDPVLSIADARAGEGGTTMRFTVSLAPAATQSVTVDYATSDGSARAGNDYDAASGTLTFAPGETSKTIDVRVRDDAAIEENETFSVTLRNAAGARVIRSEGIGIIDDDDAASDLALSVSFTANVFGIDAAMTISNNGPSAATDVATKLTSTPGASPCVTCAIPQLASGKSQPIGQFFDATAGGVWSAAVTAHQRDPQPSNNSVTWSVSGDTHMVVSPAFLVTGGTATVGAVMTAAPPAVTSSDSSVVSVGPITKPSSTLGTFSVTGLKPGTATLTIANDNALPLTVSVVAPGTSASPCPAST